MAAFLFGPHSCSWLEAFYLSSKSLAIVNYKPIVPGHCLVLTRRVVPRIQDMDADEIVDLWKTVHLIAPKLQLHFNAEALTIAVQDGPAAGQTVPHVHVHIIPRKSGDFPLNDEVYQTIDNPDEKRKPRSLKEMEEEALLLRPIFHHSSLPIPVGKHPEE